jgi:phytoene dehydrogenase-like protein
MESYDVAVVGGGHNGLACAALLAQHGARVVVCERADHVGGAAVSLRDLWPGYTVSAASYVCSLLDPWLVERLRLREHGYHAYPKDPSSYTPSEDGRELILGSNAADNARAIAAFDPRDVAGYAAFVREAERLGALLFDTFADDEPSWRHLPEPERRVMEGSVAELVRRFVRTPILQATLATDGLIGTYRGPEDPGTAYVLAHHYAGRALGTQGQWGYVRGGMGAISEALARAARAYGAELRCDARVVRITADAGRANGVVLEDGTEIAARAVAVNVHPRTAFLDLVGEATLRAHAEGADALLERLRRWESIGPSLKLNLALHAVPRFGGRDGLHPYHAATIHIAPDLAYLQRAYEQARAGAAATAPMLECFMQTPVEPELAPPGKHILSIFAQWFPYDKPGGWSREDGERAADTIVAVLSRFAPNLPDAIEARQILTPLDLEERFGLIGGHIFHGELLPGQIFDGRFPVRTPLRGLYLCGSGTHPGGCVSGFPGRRAARAIARDLAGVVR